MIIIDNKKLHDLIATKDELVKGGRKISSELETIEFKINKIQNKEKKITGNCEPKELLTKGEIARLEMERAMKAFDKIAAEIKQTKLDAIPKEMKEEHFALMATREKLENDRNKIALKIQKIKDKLIPMLKKEIKPHLKEFDDTETVEIKDGKVHVKTFNHLDDFKARFKKR